MKSNAIWQKLIIPALLLAVFLAVPALAATGIPDNGSNANSVFIPAANEAGASAGLYGAAGEIGALDPEPPAASPAEGNPPMQTAVETEDAGTPIELPQQNGLNLTVLNKQRPGLYDSVHPGTYFFNIGNNMYNGGQNAIHISDSYLTPDGTITVTDSPTGTFYITDTGGKGYEDEAILLIAVQETGSSAEFSIDLVVEGYKFLDHAANVAPTADEVGDFNSEAYVATLNASDFLTYDGALVSQAWKPSTGSADDVNMKFFDGQDLAGPKYNLILVDLNTSIVGRNAAYQTTLTNYGNPKVTYTIHGYSGGNVSFAPYAYVSYQTGGGSAFDRTVGWASRSSTNSWLVTLAEAGTAPVANFSANVTSGDAPLAVQFTDASTGSPTSWAWDFENDGTVDSTEQNPAHTYTATGTYSVNLTVANTAGTNSTLKAGYINVTGSRNWTVGATGCDFTTITDAISNPLMRAGDTVFVYNGTYETGSTSASQSVKFTLTGEGADVVTWSRTGAVSLNGPGTVVEGITFAVPAGSGNQAVKLYGSDSELRNCIFEGGGGTLLYAYAPRISIENNIFRNTWFGQSSYAVYIRETSNCSVANNTFSNIPNGYPIIVYKSTSNTIENNTFTSVRWGIRLNQPTTADNSIIGNTFTGCSASGGGVAFDAAGPNNTVYLNNFIGNGRDISYSGTAPAGTSYISPDPITYTYQGTTYSAQLGNYWDTYPGFDADGNGIGETSHPLRTSEPLDADIAPLIDRTQFYFGAIHSPVVSVRIIPDTAQVGVSDTAQFTAAAIDTDGLNVPSLTYTWSSSNETVGTVNQTGFFTAHAFGETTLTASTGGIGNTSVVSVLPPPAVDFTAAPLTGTAPLQVQFNDTSANTPTSWLWDFGDGANSAVQNPGHTYTAPGTYSVNLTATNVAGSSSNKKTGYITVTSQAPPVASFNASVTSGRRPLSVAFTDTSTGYNITAWSWDFGDGTNATGQNPVHTFTSSGNFTVTLTVTNDGGSNATSLQITASSEYPPIAAFSANRTQGKFPLAVQFADESIDSPHAWLWDFGDGTNATEQNPVHTYAAIGEYDVGLTATNVYGSNTTTEVGYIVVRDTAAMPLSNHRNINIYVANDEGVKYDEPDGITRYADIGIPYNYVPNTYFVMFGTAGGGTNPMDVSSDPTGQKGVDGQITRSTNQSGELWVTFNGGQTYMHEGILLLAVNGTIPDDFAVRIRSSGYDFVPPIPSVGNNDTVSDPVYVEGAVDQTFAKEDFIYGPQIWRPFGTPDLPIYCGQDMSDTENTFQLMFIDLRLGAMKTGTDQGSIKVEYQFNNLTSFAVFNAYGWYRASNHGTGIIMSNYGSDYGVIGDGTYAPAAPVANFTATPLSGDAPLAVNFTDLSTGSPTSWAWDFENDGVVDSTEQNPAHTFTTAGTFTVNLTVTNSAGSSSVEQTVMVSSSDGGGSGLADTPWPKSGHDLRNTGQSPYTGPQMNVTSWTFTTGNNIRYGNPLIGSDGTIYVGSIDGQFYALYPNGTVKWKYDCSAGGNHVYGSGAIGADGTVYVSNTGYKLYAVDLNGTTKWIASGGTHHGGPAIGPDGTIYTGLPSGLNAIYPENGSIKWTYPTGAIEYGSPAIGTDGTIYIGSTDSKIYAVNPDGTLKWSYTAGGGFESQPAIGSDGTIYAASNDKSVYALNSDGTLKWSYTTEAALQCSPAIATDGTIYTGGTDGKVYAINPDGTLKWSYTAGGSFSYQSAAIGSDGTIYIGSNDYKVYAIDADGTLKWSYATGNRIQSTPSISPDGTLYVGSYDCKLYAFHDPVTPVADFSADVLTGVEPLTVSFTDMSANLPTSWAWDFGDGDGTNATVQNSVHTYLAPGTYTVTLTAANRAGNNSVTKNSYITVNAAAAAPVADFTASAVSGIAPIYIQFTDTSTGDPVWRSWDLGDGTTSNATKLTHLYLSAGTYPVTLTVTNSRGSTSKTISVTVAPGTQALWPKFGGPDLNNTGRSLYVGAQTNATKWVYATGGQFRSAVPVIGSDGTVYIGNYDKNIYAFNPDGTVKWTYTTGAYLSGPPAIGADGTIYIGNYNEKMVYALNPDGTLKWTYTTTGGFMGGPTIGPDGTIYIGNSGSDRSLYALNPDGTKKWSYSCGGNINGVPAIGPDGTIYFVGGNSLFAVNPDGTLKWSYTTGGSISSAPAIGPDGLIYVGSGDNKLYAFNPDGTLNWTYTSGGRIYCSPAIGTDGIIYFGNYNDNKIYALNPDGTEKWTYLTGGAINSASPAIGADGTIYIGNSGDYKVYALNPDGTLKWFYETGNQIRASPAIAPDGTVYIGSYDGNLYAFDGVVNATADTPVGQAPLAVNFQGTSPLTVTAWNWDFGDGTTSAEQNPSHTYASAGAYTVNLTITHADGTSYHRQTEYIKAYDTPAAGFTSNITEGPYPLAVGFTDTSTNAPTSWNWDFGDGSTSTEQNPVHTYTSAGTYTVALTAANPAGSDTTTRTNYITVSAPVIPQASFTASQTAGAAPLTVQFNDTSLYHPTAWLWDFGDGNTSSEQNPSHTYSYAGTFTVSLNATNSGGSDTVTRTEYISVSDPAAPTASFTASQRVGIAPLTVRFTDTSEDYPTSWLWDFGDGNTSTEQNPTHTYTAIGEYNVSLTAANADGSDTITKVGYIVTTGTGPTPLPAGRSFNLFVANDEGVKYNVENGVTNPASYTPYVFIDNTYHFLYNGQGGGTNALHVSNDPSVTAGQVTTTTNQSGEFWFTFTGGQPNLHDAVLLLAVNGTIPDDFAVRIRSSGYDFEPPIPSVGNNNTISDPVYVDGAINQTFTKEDFIYGPQIWRPHRVSDYPVFEGQDMSDTANTFELMFIDLRLGCTQTKSDGYIRIEYEFNNLSSFAVFNGYGWYSASNHGTGIIMTTSGSEYQVIGDGTFTPVTPTANFTANVTAGDAPLSVAFTDASTGSPAAWAWDFENDGIVDSTEQNPQHTYASGGNYTVNLTVANDTGTDTLIKTDYIAVTAPVFPVANFTANITSGPAPLPVRFTDTSTGNPAGWLWEFGDGEHSTDRNPAHTYVAAGTYTVNLTVVNDIGTDSMIRTDYIQAGDARVITSIIISPAGAELKIGGRQKFAADPLDQYGHAMSGIGLAWGSGNETVGTINKAGMFTALAPGETTVTVSNGSVLNTSHVLVIPAAGEQKQASTIDIPGCNITEDQNGTATISINTSEVDVTVGENEIVISKETFNMTITTEGNPGVHDGVVNGTVAGIRIDTVPVVTDLEEAGMVSASVGANLTGVPAGAGLDVTISDNVSADARSAFELAASQDGLTVDAVAYVMNVNRTNLANGADIAEATIQMSVSITWVAAHGGNESVQIIRWAEDGTKEVLETKSLGYDGEMEIFEAISPNGLSLFGLAIAPAQPVLPPVPIGAGGSSSGGSRSVARAAAAKEIGAGGTENLTFGDPFVTGMEIHAKFDIPEILVTLDSGKKPGDSDDPGGDVYGYACISYYKAPPDSVQWVTIRFTIPADWANRRISSPDLVSLYRYNEETEEWTLLSTVFESEKSGGYAYYADSASAGYFAAVAHSDIAEAAATPTVSAGDMQQGSNAEQKTASARPATTAKPTPLFGGEMIVCVAFAIFCVLALLNRRNR